LPSDPTSPFKLYRRRFPTKIVFVRLKGRRINMLEHIDHHLFFPRPGLYGVLSIFYIWRHPCCRLGLFHRIENNRFITQDILYRNCFKASDIKINLPLLHILLFLHANYFRMYNWLMHKPCSNKDVVQLS